MMMKNFNIESNIPVPKKELKYPLDEMFLNDSFLFGKEHLTKIKHEIRKYHKHFDDATGKDFLIKKIDNDNLRIWRIK